MAKKKAGGTSKNLRDSQPKYWGVKRADGQMVKAGEIIVRQRGTKIEAGTGVKVAKDHTLFALVEGVVSFTDKRKTTFTGAKVAKKVVNIVPVAA
mgnify:CR=1 FL=1